jgi:cytochrome P450 family 6
MEGMGIKYHMFDIILKVYNECKGKDVICGFYNLTQPVYVVLDPKVVKQILVKDFNYFVNRGVYVNEENEPLSGLRDFFYCKNNFFFQI